MIILEEAVDTVQETRPKGSYGSFRSPRSADARQTETKARAGAFDNGDLVM